MGKTTLAVRLPSAVSGTLTVAFLIMLVKLTTGNSKLALIAGLSLASSPWQIHFSRAGFEANLSLFFTTAGIFCLLRGLKKQIILIFALVSILISFFTYHSARVFLPLFLIAFFIVEKKKFKEIFIKKYVYFFLALIIVFPVMQRTINKESESRAYAVSFLPEVKSNSDKFFTNKIILSTELFIKNYLNNFSINFLFFSGDGFGRHSVREMGELYLWQLPFLIYGLRTAFARAVIAKSRIFWIWLLFAPIAASFAEPNPHALRSLRMVIPLNFFVAFGILQFFKSLNLGTLNKIAISGLSSFFLFLYLHIYYVHYPNRTSPDWSGGYRQAIEYVLKRESNYDTIYFTNIMMRGYAYLYFYGNFDPNEVQKVRDFQKGVGKYRFVNPGYQAEKNEKAIYVADVAENPNWKLLTEIKNRGNDTVFKIWEN